MNREVQKKEIKIPYKNQFLKQITNGKYGSKTYNALLNKRRGGGSKTDLAMLKRGSEPLGEDRSNSKTNKLFINKTYPVANDDIDKLGKLGKLNTAKKQIDKILDFATEEDPGCANPVKNRFYANKSTGQESIIETLDENTNKFIEPISYTEKINKSAGQIDYLEKINELKKEMEKMSIEITKIRNTQKIIVKYINKLHREPENK